MNNMDSDDNKEKPSQDLAATSSKENRDVNKMPKEWDYRHSRRLSDSFDEFLKAMKRATVQHHSSTIMANKEMSPRERRRNLSFKQKPGLETSSWDLAQATRINTIASMVPDEIIYRHTDYSIRSYDAALMFIDVSGFTDLCEAYTAQAGRGGPSRLTQVLNSYIGAMVQEILTHSGDVLKFSGDAFLSMWRKSSVMNMQDVVHSAIDCGLVIQKNYGRHMTDIGIVLKVKVAISAGMAHFAMIGDENMSHYVIVGQPVWDVKMAEYMSSAGDVLTSASAWIYVNEAEYCTQPCGDGRHTKVLGIGATWKRVEKIDCTTGLAGHPDARPRSRSLSVTSYAFDRSGTNLSKENQMNYREYSLRPAIIAALRSTWWPQLRRFMVTPVLRAVDNDEPMDFLSEIRHVVVVFLNIITQTVTEDVLISIVDRAYRTVFAVSSQAGGLVNKVSMFDKDMMFLVVFGLRGLKHEAEAQKALLCAYRLKETLVDPNIISVSIGVTSGRTYCGVVGHVLRREYTVIGPAVNKAARLMMAYPNIVTCDKETFVRSKLDLDFFRLMETKNLKGIKSPGPVYEFNKSRLPEKITVMRHPLLGRNEEMRKFKRILQNAIDHEHEIFTRYRDHKYGIAITGPRLVGKSRLLDEFLTLGARYIPIGAYIKLYTNVMKPFQILRMMLCNEELVKNPLTDSITSFNQQRNIFENKLRYSVDLLKMSTLQLYALNIIFDCRFPLPENYTFTGDLLVEPSVRSLLTNVCKQRFPSLSMVLIKNAEFIDDESWKCIIILLDAKCIFVVLAVNQDVLMTPTGKQCLSNHMIVNMPLSGIDRWYHAALACQLLDVQAIPSDLEKMIESASGGLPGWIQNFVISLIQRGQLTVVTVPRNEAVEAGAIMPSPALLTATNVTHENVQDEDTCPMPRGHKSSFQSFGGASLIMPLKQETTDETIQSLSHNEKIQMAVLTDTNNFNNFENIKMNIEMDVIILKTYDSLSPFEKMLLKCGAVLGENFSRRMLLHLLQNDSQIKIAKAVAKLFEIRVLECEGGDFTRDTSMVLIHPAPVGVPHTNPPFCSCLGTRAPPNCQDLPSYAFCGYMKFRHTLFRKTTYELLTENQKRELHGKALLYLERYTRRCISCGGGCFVKLFGVLSNDGMIPESKKVQRVRQQISALAAETRMTSGSRSSYPGMPYSPSLVEQRSKIDFAKTQEDNRLRNSIKNYQNRKAIRTFSSMEVESCECLSILLSVYNQVIDHFRAVGECDKLFETYMEYCELSRANQNIPQAIKLLAEADDFVYHVNRHCPNGSHCHTPWIKDMRLARILTNRGASMLETREFGEAEKHLMKALSLYHFHFPTSKCGIRLKDLKESSHQNLAMCMPRVYLGVEKGYRARYFEHVSRTLNTIHDLFNELKEFKKAELAAKWSLNCQWKSNSNFKQLCIAYAQMIAVYRTQQKYSKCLKLKKMAMEMCHRKKGQLDVTEVYAVVSLYTSVFLFFVESGKKVEGLEFGISVIPMIANVVELSTSQMLVLWMLKLLLSDLRLHEMVLIMREFFYMSDNYDLSSETWYYYYAVVILLDTGYSVESYVSCEKFYITKGDAIFRSKSPQAAWNYFVCMWLVTVRVGAWESSILWEEKIRQLYAVRFDTHEFTIMLQVRLIEGLLITLVKEIDHRNVKRIITIIKSVEFIFERIKQAVHRAPLYKPRYFLYRAYYEYIRGKKSKAFAKLNKAQDVAKQIGHSVVSIWIDHTRKHWNGTLNSKLVNFWVDHIEADNLLDYSEFDPAKSQIVPYTLPLPKDFD